MPGEMPGTVLDVVKGGISRIQGSREAEGGWELQQQAEKIISQLGLEADRVFNSLSAGLKRQVLLARALAGKPDILLLDEPTNHMDIESIKRLEEMSLRFTGAIILVTHDRMFLQRIATRIVEIDRGRLFDQSCDYDDVSGAPGRRPERSKRARMRCLIKSWKRRNSWIRGGIKARRTRNEGRVRELQKMREIRRERRERPGIIKIEAQEA